MQEMYCIGRYPLSAAFAGHGGHPNDELQTSILLNSPYNVPFCLPGN